MLAILDFKVHPAMTVRLGPNCCYLALLPLFILNSSFIHLFTRLNEFKTGVTIELKLET